jgi:hypothetical protein
VKKPAKGGIPAVDSNTKANIMLNVRFVFDSDVQLIKCLAKDLFFKDDTIMKMKNGVIDIIVYSAMYTKEDCIEYVVLQHKANDMNPT